ncbi:MAG: 2-hydroxyacid dehydrogenase [Eubacteriales bacterium]
MKIAFFDTKDYDKTSFDLANKDRQFSIQYYSDRLSEQNAYLAKDFDAVCCFVNDRLSLETLTQLASFGVKLIAMRCAGVNNIDLAAADKLGIVVVNVPRYSPEGVAEHTLALILSLNRKVHKAYLRTKDYNFSLKGLMGFNMRDKVVGVIGMGAIGRNVARLLRAFGCQVLAYDIRPNKALEKELGVRFTELSDIWAKSDIITLHCPLTDQTRHIISSDSIAKMKDGVMMINTSRGGLVDTAALINGIRARKIGTVGLDVYEEETEYFFEDLTDEILDDQVLLELLALPNVLVTSHQAFFTREALAEISKTTLENVNEFVEQKPFTFRVTAPKGA